MTRSSLTDAAVLERQAERESNARTYARAFPLVIERGQGSWVYTHGQEAWLDFFMGAGALPLGHSPPELVEVASAQLATFAHGLDVATPARDAFITALLETLPEAWRDRMRVHVCGPTGADAVEAALKLCRIATGRANVVAYWGSYHGCTQGTLAVSSEVELRELSLPALGNTAFLPYASCGRCPVGLERATCSVNCAAVTEAALSSTHSGLARPAAVLFEPVQGEGGVVIPPPGFLERVARSAREAGARVIVDEVQTGIGRTGRWWGFEHSDFVPDVICASKALSGMGLPLAAILYHRDLDVWPPGAHIGTFRGHQVAMASGALALRLIEERNLLEAAEVRGRQLREGLEDIVARRGGAAEVRARGLMLGVELLRDGRPAGEVASAWQRACFDRHLLVERGGPHNATLRLLPALTVTEEECTRALEVLDDALAQAEEAT